MKRQVFERKVLRAGFGAISLLGVGGALVFGAYAWLDWTALQKAWRTLEAASGRGDAVAIQMADIRQNAHRVNLFAEGVWTLLAAILATLGLLGLSVSKRWRE